MKVDEATRLAVLEGYYVLDTPPEAEFDELVLLASTVLATPIALVTFVDGHRQWFKARLGLELEETPRAIAFCAYGMESDSVLEVPDALLDARFADNPLVLGAPHIRFYAGAPLIEPSSGASLGTLCVIDRVPRTLSGAQRAALTLMAKQVVSALVLRRLLRVRHRDVMEARGLLRHADRLALVGKMAAGVAHELGTPLAVVSGRAKMMLAQSLPQEQWPTHARIISEQADRMAAIIRQLLELARRREPRRVLADLRSVARQTAVMLLTEANKRGLTLRCEEDPTPRTASIDVSQMLQVVSNLAVNALHASPRGATVTLRTGAGTFPDPEGQQVSCTWLSVEDRGTGIAPQHLPHIFEPFFSTKKTGEGTGLGLAVASSITRDHGGFIHVDSTLSQGSTFRLCLPLEPLAAAPGG